MSFKWIFQTGAALLALALSAQAQDQRPVPRPERPALTSDATPDPAISVADDGTAVVVSSKSPTPRPGNLLAGFEMKMALLVAQRGDWQAAKEIAAGDGVVAVDVIEWQRLRAGNGRFSEYRFFLARNSDWPGLKLLRRRGEARIPEDADAAQVIAYFKPQPPQTGRGVLRLAAALRSAGAETKAKALVAQAWREMAMPASAEAALIAAWPKVVAPLHTDRLDRALWEEDIKAAKRMLKLVDDGWRKLAAARLGLQRKAGNVDTLIKAVPAALADDPGLAHARMNWQVAKRRRDEAAKLILQNSGSAESLGKPKYWANWRRILARQEMRGGNGERAYKLASNHHLQPGSNYADLEWLSGYLALRYLNKPEQALTHFRRFRTAVYTPISLGRAGYWEGRALAAMGKTAEADHAYHDAARYQTSFYGQLASELVGKPMEPALTGGAGPLDWRGAGFAQSSVFKAAGLFFNSGQTWETTRFLRHLSEITPESELVALGDYALSLGDPYIAVRVAKQIAREGVVAPRAYYPLANLGQDKLPVAEELALAIARRESEFHSEARSGVGARGLMQLMPATAKQMAGALGLPYAQAKLTSDPAYNAQLGSAYLAHLIEQFGNNIVLVSVGYNAGPHRSKSWIEARGDPRYSGTDVVDWIEHIPFRETRNYVMRVAESLPVYRARLTGKPAPLALSKELKAR